MSTSETDEPELEGALKPPLKWAGGKRWLVPFVKPVWERFADRRLVEPFAGGLAVTLGLMPERALLNDVSPYLINLYRWIKEDGRLRAQDWQLPGLPDFDLCGNEPPTEAEYYAARERFNELLRTDQRDSAEAAQLFYFLNRTGFNGLCRFNSKGEYNVPRGDYRTITYRRDFTEYQQAFRRWEFRVGDFSNIILETEPADFLYVDPPYDTPFTKYAPEDFKWEDQVRLAQWIIAHEGPVVVSNQATDRMVALYERHGFAVRYHDAPRRISRTGDRTPAEEILAFHNIPSAVVKLSGGRARRKGGGDGSLDDAATQRALEALDSQLDD